MIPMRGVPRPFVFFLRSREPIRPGSISPSTRPHGRRRPISRIFFSIWNGYAYGKDAFGVKRPRALEASLSTVDVTYNKVVSDEHDLLNCCAIYGIHGGMTAAASHLSGHPVRVYYGDTREPRHVRVRDMADEIRRVVRGKLLNPRWIAGMKRHGYKGAGDMAKRAGRVYGWDATTGLVDDGIFDDMARTFVLDAENRAFFEEHNPWALEETPAACWRPRLGAYGRPTRKCWTPCARTIWTWRVGWRNARKPSVAVFKAAA